MTPIQLQAGEEGVMKARAPRSLIIGLVVVLVALVVPFAYAALSEDHPAGTIGAGSVVLTEEQLVDPSVVDAFIPTDSASKRCLVTLAESNVASAGQTVYCNQRNLNGVDGIRIVINHPAELPSDFVFGLTVYQQLAKSYGQPVLYTGP